MLEDLVNNTTSSPSSSFVCLTRYDKWYITVIGGT